VGLVTGNLLEVTYKVVNLLVTPLFVLFFMAMFVPRATTFGAWVAAAASTAVAIGIAFFHWFGLSFLWIMPGSLLAGVVAGPAASLLPVGQKSPIVEPD
jgi:SSS family solute:Na+ symporter